MGTRAAATAAPRHVLALRAYRRTRAVALVLVAAVAFGGGLAGFTLLRLGSNVRQLPSVSHLVAPPVRAAGQDEQPDADDPMAGRAVNILLLGTDDRSGENAELAGADPGGGSDTTLVVHLSADRSRVEVVSIPRDTRAEIPACHLDRDVDGRMSRPRTAKFNAAFAIGWATGDPALAAACTISTVQTMTGLTVDGVAIVDMAGFVGMVEAVGGVRVCVPEPLRDTRYTGLDLPAGWADLDGVTALQYVRARHVEGSDGTDPARIARQHEFLGALVRKVLSSDVLSSPLALGRFLDAVTSSLTVSAELADPGTLLGLAWSLRGLDAADLSFTTVPWAYAPGGYVVWTQDAQAIWTRLLADEPLADGAVVTETDGVAPGAGTAVRTAGPANGSTRPATVVELGSGVAGPGSSQGGPATVPPPPSARPLPGVGLRTAADAASSACG